jgi:hypothetical protein
MSYTRFGVMIMTSTLVMFVLMYLNTYAREHIFFSETRAYMALLMGAAMAFVMLGYMAGMYPSRGTNAAIFAGSVVVFAAALWLVRSQATVSGESYMRAMIPHHSIAVMTSERAQIRDPRVRKLAVEIIAAQRREIAGSDDGGSFSAPGVAMTVRSFEGDGASWRSNAERVFALDAGLRVGYRGFFACGERPNRAS